MMIKLPTRIGNLQYKSWMKYPLNILAWTNVCLLEGKIFKIYKLKLKSLKLRIQLNYLKHQNAKLRARLMDLK